MGYLGSDSRKSERIDEHYASGLAKSRFYKDSNDGKRKKMK